jgi:DNA ligase-associated metallophosphoesterase
MSNYQTITWHNEEIYLLPEKGVYWPGKHLLAVADIHIGKNEYFQYHGINIPKGDSSIDLERLLFLTKKYQLKQLLILGDFTHQTSTLNAELNKQISSNIDKLDCEIVLVEGNHDHGISNNHLPWCESITITPTVGIDPFLFAHGDKPLDINKPVIQGHIHPVINIKYNRQKLRVPCFVVTTEKLILPSFGTFTGGYEIKPNYHNQIYMVAEGKVIKFQK